MRPPNLRNLVYRTVIAKLAIHHDVEGAVERIVRLALVPGSYLEVPKRFPEFTSDMAMHGLDVRAPYVDEALIKLRRAMVGNELTPDLWQGRILQRLDGRCSIGTVVF